MAHVAQPSLSKEIDALGICSNRLLERYPLPDARIARATSGM